MSPADPSSRRPRLTPAIADVRRAVRAVLPAAPDAAGRAAPTGSRAPGASGDGRRAGGADPAAASAPLVLVALSGGPDSLALAAATAFEAPRAGVRAGAVIVDHGLQPGSDAVAARAADQARMLGLAPVVVARVQVGGPEPAPAPGGPEPSPAPGGPEPAPAPGGPEPSPAPGGPEPAPAPGGPEAAARTARYAALERAARETGAVSILTAHTLDDQAETVLLGLARGSGALSLAGMPAANGLVRRPLLGIPRATTHAFCADAGLEPWHDPMNDDERYARVRVRRTVLPTLEAQLGPGVAAALARTAEQLREDAEALDAMVAESLEDLCEHAEAGISLPVAALAANPPALRNRIIRQAVAAEFGAVLHRSHVLAVTALITDWHGQAGADLPGVRVVRRGGLLVFSAA